MSGIMHFLEPPLLRSKQVPPGPNEHVSMLHRCKLVWKKNQISCDFKRAFLPCGKGREYRKVENLLLVSKSANFIFSRQTWNKNKHSSHWEKNNFSESKGRFYS